MASCNNCNLNLKEKEQVYTSARDGNIIYLKVSVSKQQQQKGSETSEKRPRHCAANKTCSTFLI